jgi:VanZ family protein
VSPHWFGRIIDRISTVDSWTLVALLFALQASAAVVFSWKCELNSKDVAPAIALLVAGSAYGWNARLKGRRSGAIKGNRWVPVLLYGLFIFYLSDRSFTQNPIPVTSDVFHPLEYATLAMLLAWAVRARWLEATAIRIVIAVVLIGVVYAVTDELHQAFVPGRSPSWLDVGYDLLGLAVGAAAFEVGWSVQGKIWNTSLRSHFGGEVRDERP